MLLPDYARILAALSLPQKDELVRLPRPAIFLDTQMFPDGDISVGVSRLGGLPDLSPGITWPNWRGKPQSFIAYINLSELPAFAERALLPSTGHLFFFYDSAQSTYGLYPSDRGSFAIFYSTAPRSEFERAPATEGLDPSAIFKPARLVFSLGNTAPEWEHPALERLGPSCEQRLYEYSEAYRQAEEETPQAVRRSGHQMLGYPNPLQMSVGVNCEQARLGHWGQERPSGQEIDPVQAEEWELLLQVDGDMTTGMEWMASGRIYYMIRRHDLKARNFAQAWLIMQTT